MKNRDIIALANSGIALSTALTLDPAHAYKHSKLRRAVAKAFEAITESEKDLARQVTIEDLQQHNSRVRDLLKLSERSEEQQAELEALQSKTEAFNNLHRHLLDDEAKLEGIKAIPFEEWLKLRRENEAKEVVVGKDQDGKPRVVTIDIFNNSIEDLLLGVFWREPEEDDADV